MGARPRVGISLQADEHFLVLNRELIENDAEVYEINPETLWDAGCEPSPMYAVFRDIVERSNRLAIGHGILYSLGAATNPTRRDAWIDALRRDQRVFGFEWFSEHLGFADHGDRHLALPLGLPPCEESVATVARNFEPLREIFPTVAFENNVSYFALGDPMAELGLFRDVVDRADCGMVLDLHNAYTTCLNFDLDLDAWLAGVPWEAVLELHLSGGSESDPDWLPGETNFRLDTHDRAVPDAVWDAFSAILPRCPNLQAVIVEWLPDGMDKAAAASFAADVHKARSMVC